ncbi:MAG: acyl-[acyl-carrier-protein] thioesterase [Prevotella sp.]|jgi:medium-chain acyl-[acyl-carrier-protein] hydrolase
MQQNDHKALLPKVGRYDFLTEPFHCDFQDYLLMGHLGNAMLNAADFHSNDRGYGMHYLQTINKTWVLSRLAIEMNEMPKAYDEFSIETWVESAMKFFTSRNFAISSRDGNRIYGYGRSIWAMIDTQNRQPVNLTDVRDGLIFDYIETDKDCPIQKAGRVKMNRDAELVRSIDTYYNDVDVNGHINSVKYIEHILDLFSLEWYRSHKIKRFEIAYVAESYQGERLNLYREQTGDEEYCVKITKGTTNEVEVVRSLIKFVNI